MAKCERLAPPPTPEFVLTLTRDEAQFLFDILGHSVAGTGRRETCSDPIYDALKLAGLVSGLKSDWSGMLQFIKR